MVSRLAMGGLVVLFLAGAWLVAAPFALRFQHAGTPWTGATRMDMAVGGVLVVAAFTGFFVALGGRVREMYADASRR
jgi:cytochrome c oxidase assembly factor CtaG